MSTIQVRWKAARSSDIILKGMQTDSFICKHSPWASADEWQLRRQQIYKKGLSCVALGQGLENSPIVLVSSPHPVQATERHHLAYVEPFPNIVKTRSVLAW